MRKAEEKLQVVTLKLPISMIQRIDERRAELQRQDPSKSYSRSDAMRHALHESLSADFRMSPLPAAKDSEKKTRRKAKARR